MRRPDRKNSGTYCLLNHNDYCTPSVASVTQLTIDKHVIIQYTGSMETSTNSKPSDRTDQGISPGDFCPFLKQNCIRERCNLFTSMPVMEMSRLASMAREKAIRGCVFHLILEALKMLGMPLPPPPRTGPVRGS